MCTNGCYYARKRTHVTYTFTISTEHTSRLLGYERSTSKLKKNSYRTIPLNIIFDIFGIWKLLKGLSLVVYIFHKGII